ncbi:MAG: hypothetical protein LN417_06285 [Candidatus Thermoplasmatota archaeon]|nr:hypothetical protein [Candidatus Thermoplasmatota archaeon]
MDKRERVKYLLKSVLGVDVDAIAAKTIASLAVERAKHVPDLTRAWLSMKDKKEWVTYALLGKK